MSAATAAALDRLQAVLDAPVTGSSIHQQVGALAEQRSHEHPPSDISVKRLAAPAEAVPETVTGEFVALISDYEEDRQGERFAKGAFDAALTKIRQAGRAIPVLFGHDAASVHAVVGMVPHDGLWADDEGLWARGQIDVSDSIGMKLHRMIKSGALAWSIGFRMPKGFRPRVDHDGVGVLDRIEELLELSAVPVPANSRTRTVGIKSDRREPPSLAELHRREREMERELGLIDPDVDKFRQATRDAIVGLLNSTNANGGDEQKTASELRAKADGVAAELAPVKVATFEC
jgi:HK97 family phage prohead protease